MNRIELHRTAQHTLLLLVLTLGGITGCKKDGEPAIQPPAATCPLSISNSDDIEERIVHTCHTPSAIHETLRVDYNYDKNDHLVSKDSYVSDMSGDHQSCSGSYELKHDGQMISAGDERWWCNDAGLLEKYERGNYRNEYFYDMEDRRTSLKVYYKGDLSTEHFYSWQDGNMIKDSTSRTASGNYYITRRYFSDERNMDFERGGLANVLVDGPGSDLLQLEVTESYNDLAELLNTSHRRFEYRFETDKTTITTYLWNNEDTLTDWYSQDIYERIAF